MRRGVAAAIGLLFVLVALARVGDSAAGRPRCATAVLEDWSDGRIDRVYPVRCYRHALDSLPEDLANYSTAGDDITRALLRRLALRARPPAERTRAAEGATAPDGWLLATFEPVPAPLVLVGALIAILAFFASAGLVTRRLRTNARRQIARQ